MLAALSHKHTGHGSSPPSSEPQFSGLKAYSNPEFLQYLHDQKAWTERQERRGHARAKRSSSSSSSSLEKSNSATKHLGLSVMLKPDVGLYENEVNVETAADNYHGFRVSRQWNPSRQSWSNVRKFVIHIEIYGTYVGGHKKWRACTSRIGLYVRKVYSGRDPWLNCKHHVSIIDKIHF